jgi:hypothetical protein
MKFLKLCSFLIVCLAVFMIVPIQLPASDTYGNYSSTFQADNLTHRAGDPKSPHGFGVQAETPCRVIVRLRQQDIRERIPGSGLKRKSLVIKQLKDRTQKLRGKLLQRLSRKKLHRSKKAFEKNPRSLWLANSIAITVAPGEIQDLMDDPAVAEVIPNLVLSIPPISTGSVENSGEGADLWNHTEIGLDFLHEQGIDGSGIRIGLLDTGLDANHPELIDKLVGWQEFDEFGNSVDSQPHETHYKAHGTHVASVLVGASVGIAPGADLISALVLPDGYGTVEQVLAGMQWILDPDGDPATDDGAQIVNMSWGLTGTSNVLEEAVESMHTAGILPVAAIGNNGHGSTFSPGNAPGAVGVGAVNQYDNVAVFSGGGEVCWDNLCVIKPDLSAPGTQDLRCRTVGRLPVTIRYIDGCAPCDRCCRLAMAIRAVVGAPATATRFLMHSARDLGSWGLDPALVGGDLDIQSAVEFIDSYANRLGSADLVIEKTKKINGTNVFRYFTYFSDGEAGILPDESDFLTLTQSQFFFDGAGRHGRCGW